jgi:hypothetical protein
LVEQQADAAAVAAAAADEALEDIHLPAPADTSVSPRHRLLWTCLIVRARLAVDSLLQTAHCIGCVGLSLLLRSIVAIKKIRLRSAAEGLSMEAVRSVGVHTTPAGGGATRATVSEGAASGTDSACAYRGTCASLVAFNQPTLVAAGRSSCFLSCTIPTCSVCTKSSCTIPTST